MKPRFDHTVSIGDIITIAGIICTIAVAYYRIGEIEKRMDATEATLNRNWAKYAEVDKQVSANTAQIEILLNRK